MNLRPMVWCMYAWSRPNDLQKSRRWWLNNILPFRGSLFSRLNSTMVFLILFARYAADSNAMQWWSSVQNLQSEDVIAFLYVDEWRQSSGTEVTVVSKVQHQTSTQKRFTMLRIFWYLASRPVNEGDQWRFEKPLRCSIDWAYNKPHWTTSFGRSTGSKRWLESDRLLQNRADS